MGSGRAKGGKSGKCQDNGIWILTGMYLSPMNNAADTFCCGDHVFVHSTLTPVLALITKSTKVTSNSTSTCMAPVFIR